MTKIYSRRRRRLTKTIATEEKNCPPQRRTKSFYREFSSNFKGQKIMMFWKWLSIPGGKWCHSFYDTGSIRISELVGGAQQEMLVNIFTHCTSFYCWLILTSPKSLIKFPTVVGIATRTCIPHTTREMRICPQGDRPAASLHTIPATDPRRFPDPSATRLHAVLR